MTKEQSAKIVADLRQKIEAIIASVAHVSEYDITDSNDQHDFRQMTDYLLKAVDRYNWTQDNDE